MIDHDGAARRQVHRAGVGRLDLVLHLEAAEQRGVVAVTFDPIGLLGHDVRHELVGLIEQVVGVDQDVANVGIEVVADGANHEAGFLIDQEGAFARLGGGINGRPELEQVVQVPLQLGCGAANAGGAGDDGHAVGVFQLVHGLFQFGPLVALDATADATTTGIVGHEDHIAASQGDEGGEGCALVATLFFFDLNQQFLAFFDDVLDAGLAGRDASGKVLF